jgi:nicotinamide mononucleotide transporter
VSEALFLEAFTLWGSPTTWLEIVAVVIALAMVGCNIREIHWGWPLAIISSLMYFALFWRSKLYGEATLQIFFAVVAFWGWFQWLRGHRGDGSALHVARLSRHGLLTTVLAGALLWPITGLFLAHLHRYRRAVVGCLPHSHQPGGQFLLGRKYIENWAAWIIVNLWSAWPVPAQGLWLTVALYTVFIVLSVVGWRAWQRSLPGSDGLEGRTAGRREHRQDGAG